MTENVVDRNDDRKRRRESSVASNASTYTTFPDRPALQSLQSSPLSFPAFTPTIPSQTPSQTPSRSPSPVPLRTRPRLASYHTPISTDPTAHSAGLSRHGSGTQRRRDQERFVHRWIETSTSDRSRDMILGPSDDDPLFGNKLEPGEVCVIADYGRGILSMDRPGVSFWNRLLNTDRLRQSPGRS